MYLSMRGCSEFNDRVRFCDVEDVLKEYEKLAREYIGLNPIYSPTDERDAAAIDGWINGFLKCRQMIENLPTVTASSNLHNWKYTFINFHLIGKVGEKEV